MKDRTNSEIRVIALAMFMAAVTSLSSAYANDSAQALTLDKAIALAQERSPGLRAVKHRVLAAEAEASQANVWSNPEIEGSLENIAGSGEFSGTDAAEITVMVSQPIRLGGKRSRAFRLADLDRQLAEWTYESTRRDLVRTVTRTFAEVLKQQEQMALTGELLNLSEELVETAARRVKAGGASVLEETKASIERAVSVAAQKQVTQQLEASRRKLATVLGMEPAEWGRVSGDLYVVSALPPFEDLKIRLEDNPAWARWTAEIAKSEATVALADAQRVPDVTLGVGWRHIEDANDSAGAEAFLVAAGLPLPLFDRNQGARQAARHHQAAATEERRASTLSLERELAEVYSDLTAAHTQAQAIKDSILPAANRSFEVSREGYLQGRFGYLDLLDAQRTLFETRADYIEALLAYHQAMADIQHLTGITPTLETQEHQTHDQ